MKKFLMLILSTVMLLSFSACGEDKTSVDTKKDPVKDTNVVSHSFSYKDTKIEMGAEADAVLPKLGEPKSVSEQLSCAFDGMDKTYYFGSFYVTTYPDKDKEFFYNAWFVDDSVTTEEGVYIGASKADVEKAYGSDSFNGLNAYIVEKGESKLTIIIKDDVVSSITYEANVN